MMSDPPLKTCPECKGRSVKRLIGAGAGFIFKGSGFYITDYRGEGYEKAKKADKAESAPSEKAKEKSDGGAADKPAADKPAADKPAAKKETPKKSASKATKKK